MSRIACALVLTALLVPCLAADSAEEGWVSLFDGETLKGWTTLDKKPVTRGWVAQDGVLFRDTPGGDIYTEKEYANFILEFEWKIAPKGNSGVKYRMARYDGQYLGTEYQVFDDGNGKDGRFLTASIYELFAPNDKKKLNPVGEWNTSRIVANGTKIEHWLNGQKVVEADTATDDWSKAVAASKFKKHADFGRSPSGRIMIQDHGSKVWYRNIRIKELPNPKP